MAMRLTDIQTLGRYECKTTGQNCNVKKGRQFDRASGVIYYLRSGKRVIIPDGEFYRDWKKCSD